MNTVLELLAVPQSSPPDSHSGTHGLHTSVNILNQEEQPVQVAHGSVNRMDVVLLLECSWLEQKRLTVRIT